MVNKILFYFMIFICSQLLFVSEHGDRICGFLFEPIQGEAGVCAYHAISDLVTLTVVVDISYTVRN